MPTRRTILAAGLGAAALLAGCAPRAAGRADAPPTPLDAPAWTPDEGARLAVAELAIVTRGGPGSDVLRRRARDVPPGLDLTDVVARMERAMERAGGVGLAAPQVGLSLRLVVLKLDFRTEHPRVVAVRNPVIVERSDDVVDSYEGCLSIPKVGGLVRRHRTVRVEYEDATGARVTAVAEGPNAVLWQHELDHLDGVLYVDRLVGDLMPTEEMRRRRRELEERDRPPPSPEAPAPAAK